MRKRAEIITDVAREVNYYTDAENCRTNKDCEKVCIEDINSIEMDQDKVLYDHYVSADTLINGINLNLGRRVLVED